MKILNSYNSNMIEKLIMGAKNEKVDLKELIKAILSVDFYIVCNELALSEKNLVLPMCIELDDEKNVCVFTRKEWAEGYINQEISVIKLLASKWLKQHPVTYGLIINPNQDACIKFSALGIQNIKLNV